eukprot:CAMPEP_0170572686 /NCGR_PEP_ID=MMETSP0224-20130122/2350_1 /TAXON_ID=285029 /ORGANISM="Togula jolla, Strain CCCM 725" /LENGTH=204 /DNA_ID=CAMNT_0010895195 /DNA_START=233 /DNA_END=848 /DNA_ORIENTATION=-
MGEEVFRSCVGHYIPAVHYAPGCWMDMLMSRGRNKGNGKGFVAHGRAAESPEVVNQNTPGAEIWAARVAMATAQGVPDQADVAAAEAPDGAEVRVPKRVVGPSEAAMNHAAGAGGPGSSSDGHATLRKSTSVSQFLRFEESRNDTIQLTVGSVDGIRATYPCNAEFSPEPRPCTEPGDTGTASQPIEPHDQELITSGGHVLILR